MVFKKVFGLFGWGKKKPAAKPVAIPVGRPKPIPAGQPGASSYPKPVAIPVVTKPKPIARPQPITTGRKIEDDRANREWYEKRGPYGTAEGAVQVLAPGSEYEEAFLNGTLNYVTSSWIAAIKYDRQAREMWVSFHDGASVTVENVSESEAISFFIAGSKGAWYWSNVLGEGYVLGSRNSLKTWR